MRVFEKYLDKALSLVFCNPVQMGSRRFLSYLKEFPYLINAKLLLWDPKVSSVFRISLPSKKGTLRFFLRNSYVDVVLESAHSKLDHRYHSCLDSLEEDVLKDQKHHYVLQSLLSKKK